ncbi:MAG: SDR family oxidoreductase [Cohaesibacter sp.]|nr:SDR family oxidoreductase [Cohaesibacter sp.]
MRILVLGGYGLIGAEICRSLLNAGHDVVGLARSPDLAARLIPQVEWHAGDLREMLAKEDWDHLVHNIDAVINAAGALQYGLFDDLQAVHYLSIKACLEACEVSGVARFVQISATGADRDADTAFMRTKAAGDDAVMAASMDWVILRPGLVLAPTAYGGTALLRLLAAFPKIQPLILADRQLQTVHVSEVTEAVLMATEGRIPSEADLDLVEEESQSLADLVAGMRRWLGFEPARRTLILPRWLGKGVSRIADGLGRLGWRSPLRSDALTMLDSHVKGDPSLWHAMSGRHCRSFEETLASMPSTTQERWFAKLALMLPIMISVLSAFWLLSGVIALGQMSQAAEVLAGSGTSSLQAQFLAASAAILDIGLGIAILIRPWAKRACLGMVVLTLVYLASASILVPHLWLDPLGSLLKAVPALLLAIITRSLLTER